MRRSAVVAALLFAGLVSLACSSADRTGDSGGEAALTRAASAGSIDVEATWLGSDGQLGDDLEAYPLDGFVLLEISLDTHSGDLGSIDLVDASALETDAGSLEPEDWVAKSDESHHRSGVLVFPRAELAAPVTLTVELEDGIAELVWEELPDG